MIAQHYTKKHSNSPIQLQHLETCFQRLREFAQTVQGSIHMPRIGATTPQFNWYGTEKLIRKVFCRRSVDTYIYYFKRGGGIQASSGASPATSTRPPRPSPAIEPSPTPATPSRSRVKPTVEREAARPTSPVTPPNTNVTLPQLPQEMAQVRVTEEDENAFNAKYRVKDPLPSFFASFCFVLPKELTQREELARTVIAFGGTWHEDPPVTCPAETKTFLIATSAPTAPTLPVLRPNFITHCAQQRKLIDNQVYQLSAPS